MTESRRRRRRDGEEPLEAGETGPAATDPETGEEEVLAGYPPVAPVRRQVPAMSRPLIGADVDEVDDDQPRRVPVERDALGTVTEVVEAPDRRAADDWDERLWHR